MAKNKLNIKKVLEYVDKCDIQYFKNLTEEEKKSLSPYILMLWMSGCKSEIQLMQLNALMNPLVFEMSPAHRDILFKLALVSSDGKRKNYRWSNPKKRGKAYSTCVSIICRQYKCSKSDALSYVKLLDTRDIVAMANEMGEQEDTIKQIKKEMK